MRPVLHRTAISVRLSRLLMAVALSLSVPLGASAVPPAASPQRPGPAADAESDLAELIEEVVAFRSAGHSLRLPEGEDSRYEERLDDVSLARYDEELEAIENFRMRLRAIDTDDLEADTAIDALILSIQLRDRANELLHRGHLMPIGSRYGFHFGFAGAPESGTFRDVEDYDRYVARLQSFEAHARGQIALMRAGIAAGLVLPSAVLTGYENTASLHLADHPRHSGFWSPFERIPDSIDAADRQRLSRDGEAAIDDSVIPGYRALFEFLRDEYVPAGRATLGVTDLPGGRSYYAHRVHMYTTLDLRPREVHEIGLQGVATIRAAMEAIMGEVGFTGTYLEFVEHLRTEPRFYVDTARDYLAAVAYAAKQMEGHLPELFGLLPRTPYGVRAIPAHVAPRHSAGYYDRGGDDGTRAGWININTSQLTSRPLFVARALAYHEGVPGHHLQIMLARENERLSDFRRSSGITVFTEGWGLYAEKLGMEVGLYEDPYDRFGMWSYQIWRACRLVVDTGMHALGWTRAEAIAYMAEHTGMALDTVTAEIDRHITEPGQGLAYTFGELKITELRQRASEHLGDRFDLRAFHDVVLGNGALPLSILEEVVVAWIEETRGA